VPLFFVANEVDGLIFCKIDIHKEMGLRILW
jgi:hypothetical protein